MASSPSSSSSSLVDAVNGGDAEEVASILSAHARPSERDIKHAFEIAAETDRGDIMRILFQNDRASILAAFVLPDVLFDACEKGRKSVVDFLVHLGIHDGDDTELGSAFGFAVDSAWEANHRDIVDKILSNDEVVRKMDVDDAIKMASGEELVQVLQAAKARVGV